jgi:apolipoprotein D and lipocalin family protein
MSLTSEMFRFFSQNAILLFSFCIVVQCNQEKPNTPLESLTPLLGIGALSYASSSPFDRFAEKNVDLVRFTGSWREMQRINTSFQADLTNVMATYTRRPDSTVGVRNEGLNASQTRVSLEGTALIPNPEVGILKVSFLFPIFFGDFIILKIDRENYQYALIGGPTPNFLWVFSRTETIPEGLEKEYVDYAKSIGYNTSQLKRFR